MTADWHASKIWVTPRDKVDAHIDARLARWGNALDGCQTPACVTIDFQNSAAADSGQDAPAATPAGPGATPAEQPAIAAPGTVQPFGLTIKRSEPGLSKSYEVLLGAVDSSGEVLGLPYIVASLPSGQSEISQQGLDESYKMAAGFKVLDMTPVGARKCVGGQCVWKLGSTY